MDTAAIFVLVILALGIVTVWMGVKSVPQGYEWPVERFGRYQRTLEPGLNLIVPYIDQVRKKLNMMETVFDIDSQEVITKDNAMVRADGVVFFQVLDAAKAAYEVNQLEIALWLEADRMGLLLLISPPGYGKTTLMEYIANQFDPSVTWDDLEWMVAEWGGPFVIKGILSPADAIFAPYLDEDLVEFSLGLPFELKLGEPHFHDEMIFKAYPAYKDVPFEHGFQDDPPTSTPIIRLMAQPPARRDHRPPSRRRASIAVTTHWLPNAALHSSMSTGRSTAAVFTVTLSAPARSTARMSATDLTPPPTVRGTKTFSAVRRTRSSKVPRPSWEAVISR